MISQTDFVVGVLTEEGRVSPAAMERAARHAGENQVPVTDALVALNIISARELAIVRASVCEVPFVDPAHYDIDLRHATRLARSAADRHAAFPLFDMGQTVVVAMADPMDFRAIDQLRGLLKADVQPVLCEPGVLRALIERAYSLAGAVAPAENAPAAEAAAPRADAEQPIVAAVNHILAQAIDQRASDIHIGPDEHALHLRYRIDGDLVQRQGPPLTSHPGIVQRLKVMANLDLTQTRRPQDGKFRFVHAGAPVDVRLSVIPTVCGENVVMRLLGNGARILSFKDLGVAPALASRLEEIIEHPHGMVLVTGPTGSGKTTTLYSALSRLNTPDRNVVTIEDPVEIRLPMARHVQVNAEIGMTFAGALRSILRQDPDVVLVGEIRDQETGRIALQAALTGHLVLSTLHTNDAPGAVARLQDFGCPTFAINAAVLCVIAQRLVRKVCPDCAKADEPDARTLRVMRLGASEPGFRRGAGCPKCLSQGFRGRMGIHEMLDMSPAVQEAIERGGSTAAVRAAAVREGMRPLWQDGLDKARLGLTTLDEVARTVAGSVGEDEAAAPRAPLPGEMRLSA